MVLGGASLVSPHFTSKGEVIMATKNVLNRTERQDADQKLIDGLNTHASTLPSLTIGGTSYTTAAVVAVLQARIAAANAVIPARASWQGTVQADRDERTKTKTFVSGLRQALLVAFAGSIETLADFGLKPRKARTPRTPEQKAAATAKAKATRAARHTMGSKQKAKVKGTVAPTAPATSPAATAPSASTPTPASATASAGAAPPQAK